MVTDGATKPREQLLKAAMSRRTKRAYKLAEQTCRFVKIGIFEKLKIFPKSTQF